jgi:NADP-reducing hydrogenase subunit HndD
MEEGYELIERIKNGGPFPMFTSCCPAWVNLVEKHYPEYIPNLSTCRSPQGMLSSLLKHYWAQKMGYDPKDVVVVSFMPCGAKKDEIKRPQLAGETDYVLTTRELGKLFKMSGLKDLSVLKEEKYDDPLGESTGAAVIFGATGGVMEAALRTAYEVVVGKPLPKIEFESVRGEQGIKKATVDLNGLAVRVAIAHTSGQARKLLAEIKKTGEMIHFIEVMACYGN